MSERAARSFGWRIVLYASVVAMLLFFPSVCGLLGIMALDQLAHAITGHGAANPAVGGFLGVLAGIALDVRIYEESKR